MKRRLSIAIALFCSSCLFGGTEDPEFAGTNNGTEGNECEVYCDGMELQCGEVTFQLDGQFDRALCLDACAGYPRVPEGVALGERVDPRDSLECRAYHLENAKRQDPNNGHCLHAGIDGADFCVDDPTCTAYCLEFDEQCGGTDSAFESFNACYGQCVDAAPDDVLCRLDVVRSVGIAGVIACAVADINGPDCRRETLPMP